MILYAPAALLCPIGLAWILTRTERTLPTTETLLSRIHAGEFDKLKDFMPHNNPQDVLREDKQFWKCVGGFNGLLRMRRNAVCFVHLCQRYVRDCKMDKQDVEYVSRRNFAIAFLILASIPEQAIRLLWWGMPHFCARWISRLYWEAATQTSMLNLEYGSGNLSL